MDRWKLLRLDYLFSVIIPCLISIYVNKLDLLVNLKTIFGWIFLGIAGNLINDLIDKDREIDWHSKELMALVLSSLWLSMLCFLDIFIKNVWNVMWVSLAIILVFLYCTKLKWVPIASTIGQVIAEILFPYFTIHNPGSKIEWLWVISLLFFSFLSQFMHESIDEEAITRFSPRVIQGIMIFSSLLILFSGSVLLLATQDLNILPFAIVPFAVIYIFRSPRKSPAKNVKDIGIILGNFFMVYLLLLIITPS
ncbi:MAG: hypothetical protein ACTSVI_14310 [Promethearchaeota archaeon]